MYQMYDSVLIYNILQQRRRRWIWKDRLSDFQGILSGKMVEAEMTDCLYDIVCPDRLERDDAYVT